MSLLEYSLTGLVASAIVAGSLVAIPVVFAGRVLPGVWLEDTALGGIALRDLPGVLQEYEKQMRGHAIVLQVRDRQVTHTVDALGVSLDIPQTTATVQRVPLRAVIGTRLYLRPRVTINSIVLENVIQQAFAPTIQVPRNATLRLLPGTALQIVTSQPGEGIERISFEEDLTERTERGDWQRPFVLTIVTKVAEIQDHEVQAAKIWGEQLLREGMQLTFAEKTWEIKPFTMRRLLEFIEVRDPNNPTNYVLGLRFQPRELEAYLTTTIAPEIDRAPQNARFAMGEDGRVTQFAVPQRGQALALSETAEHINASLLQQQLTVPVVVTFTEPTIDSAEDIAALGITALLTTGESDFSGSPKNRVHNIETGTQRYHGLLLPPGQEFSFNEHLGPVTAEAGFKPELVIKHNVTTPEFGGGLCQVSTTIFRAAVQAGLEITDRRNHAYAVRYYGTPGFDATIYPPYTDLRFINNTPGYILIQARVTGFRLAFEFWGTPDGRSVEIVGPHPYAREANGAVKATLTQKVTKEGTTLLEKKFYSRYKSPNLFPKVVAADQGRT